MKHKFELDFNKSVATSVEAINGWDKENPHRLIVNINIADMSIEGLIEEDAECFFNQLDSELHDETYPQLEDKYFKALSKIDELMDRLGESENEVMNLREHRRVV